MMADQTDLVLRDDLLSLLQATAYNLYLCTLVGDPAPIARQANERIANPQQGDWVMEVSTIYRVPMNRVRFGKLLRVTEEPMHTAAEWADDTTPIPTERVFYIELLDGTERRWTNASFIAIPNGIRTWEAA